MGTREHIIEILQKQREARAEELAELLKLAPATVRRHLDILQRDNLVAYEVVHRDTGRPHHSYFLTEASLEMLPRKYHRLSSSLIQELASLGVQELYGKDGLEVLAHLYQRMGQRLAARHGERMLGKDLGERVAEVCRILNEEGFSAECRTEGDHYALVAHNCPYRLVAEAHQSLCAVDQTFIKGLLGVNVMRETSRAGGQECCSYIINKSEGDPKKGSPRIT
ncbi:MAG: ArsR family transcriptional regulator [Chloroflexi bacterium]|nr:ArsR family transcriptional regulator [Chloroflexota bacterium]